MTARPDLAAIAPRLARARDQRIAELGRERAARRRCLRALGDVERIVAHRELQLLRANARVRRGDPGGYIAHRERKLAAARAQLARLQAKAERLGIQTPAYPNTSIGRAA